MLYRGESFLHKHLHSYFHINLKTGGKIYNKKYIVQSRDNMVLKLVLKFCFSSFPSLANGLAGCNQSMERLASSKYLKLFL